MSEGEWDYCYRNIEGIAERLNDDTCTYRQCLGQIMAHIALVMKAIEWCDSEDISKQQEYLEYAFHLTRVHYLIENLLEELSVTENIDLDFSQGPDYE